MTSARAIALWAAGGRSSGLADATAEVLAGFGLTPDRLGESAQPDAAAHAIAIVFADREVAGRFARSFSGPVLLVPDGQEPDAALAALREAASGDPELPIGVLAAGEAGARNAALFAVAMLAGGDPVLGERYRAFRESQTAKVLAARLE